MDTTLTEIAPDTFRISTFHPDFGIQFNQFLVRDDEPFLMHTGLRRMFPTTRAAVAQVIDPATLRWIGFSHFEPDECGALNDWLAAAPRAQAMSGPVGSMVMLNDFADRPPRMLHRNAILQELGEHSRGARLGDDHIDNRGLSRVERIEEAGDAGGVDTGGRWRRRRERRGGHP